MMIMAIYNKPKIIFITSVTCFMSTLALTTKDLAGTGLAFIFWVPLSIFVGRLALWFVDKFYLFYTNFKNPDNIRKKINRDIWEVLMHSFLIGIPLFYFLVRP